MILTESIRLNKVLEMSQNDQHAKSNENIVAAST